MNVNERSIFASALDITDSAQRAAYLDSVCADDADLRRRLDHLLAAHEQMGDFLAQPVLAPTVEAEPPSEGPSSMIGPYKLLQQIGEGGMGVVYMAEQQEPIRRKVALKIIKPGMDSHQVVARFEAERQALAMMDHVNIAKVLDAGTTPTGRPYFVMELVHGVPITKYCDDNKLTPRQRLELFVQVCQAIQHAHQKGIIHRDIKPSNVLVTMYDDRPVPKVIDFGVAKAIEQRLTEKTLFTQFGGAIGTFEYMSPEQAELNAFGVDTRSDIYSLGVLLYELLTGTTPLERARLREAAYGEIVRLIKEEEPIRPSQRLSNSGEALPAISQQRATDPTKLADLVRDELDWLVLKCLEKDRSRRYETANALAREVQRYLADEPIEARPPTLGYRLAKTYRKHRTAILLAGTIAAVLLLATGVSLAFGLIAQQAATETAAANKELRKTQDELQGSHADLRQTHANLRQSNANLRQSHAKLRSNQYLWDMQLVPTSLEVGNHGQAMQLLARHKPTKEEPEDLRGFEWHYWDRKGQMERSSRKLETSIALAGRTSSVWVFSGDGTRVACFTTTFRPLLSLEAVARRYVVSVWDVASGKEVLAHQMAFKQDPPAGKKDSTNGVGKDDCQLSANGSRVAVARSFEDYWKHLQVVDVATGMILFEHDNPEVTIMNWHISPDGRLLAAEVRSKAPPQEKGLEALQSATFVAVVQGVQLPQFGPSSLKVWDLNTGKELISTAPAPRSICFSADSKRLLSYTGGGRGFSRSIPGAGTLAKVITSLATQDLLSALIVTQQITDATMSTGPTQLEYLFRAVVWDTESGEKSTSKEVVGHWGIDNFRRSNMPGDNLSFSSDGVWMYAEGKVFDVATGKERYAFDVSVFTDGDLRVIPFFNANKTRLAVMVRRLGKMSVVRLWDLVKGNQTCTITLSSGPGGSWPEFSHDGRWLLDYSGSVLTGWNTDTGKVDFSLNGHLKKIAAIAFSRDDRRLFSVEYDGILKEWELQPKGAVLVPTTTPMNSTNTPSLSALSERALPILSPDASRITRVVSDIQEKTSSVEIWDVGTSQRLKLLTTRPHESVLLPIQSAFSGDGQKIALVRGVTREVAFQGAPEKVAPTFLTVWDIASEKEIRHLQLPELRIWAGGLPCLAFAPNFSSVGMFDQKTMAEQNGELKLVNVESGKVAWTVSIPGQYVESMAFSPDGRRLAGFVLNMSEVYASPASRSGKLMVWDATTGKELASGEYRPPCPRSSITWSPDGNRLAIARFMPNLSSKTLLKVYDAATCQELCEIVEPGRANSSIVRAITFSPDSRRIAGYAIDFQGNRPGDLTIWDAATGKEMLALDIDNITGAFQRPGGLHVRGNGASPDIYAGLSFTPDGHRLVFFSNRVMRKDNSVAVQTWDATPRVEPKP